MNIFVLDTCPVQAAKYQCDKHVVKMVLETAQLLCSPFDKGAAPYRRTHYNHPCSKWVRESQDNYEWLIRHGLALASEYNFRYDKFHKSLEVIKWCGLNGGVLKLPKVGLTPFAQAMPDECKNTLDVVDAYRTYYREHKARIAKWTKRAVPEWFK